MSYQTSQPINLNDITSALQTMNIKDSNVETVMKLLQTLTVNSQQQQQQDPSVEKRVISLSNSMESMNIHSNEEVEHISNRTRSRTSPSPTISPLSNRGYQQTHSTPSSPIILQSHLRTNSAPPTPNIQHRSPSHFRFNSTPQASNLNIPQYSNHSNVSPHAIPANLSPHIYATEAIPITTTYDEESVQLNPFHIENQGRIIKNAKLDVDGLNLRTAKNKERINKLRSEIRAAQAKMEIIAADDYVTKDFITRLNAIKSIPTADQPIYYKIGGGA